MFFLPKFSENDPMSSYCQKWWNNPSICAQFSQKWTLAILDVFTLTIFKFVNLPGYYLFNILLFCINFVGCIFHRGMWSFNFISSHFPQSTTFFVLAESVDVKLDGTMNKFITFLKYKPLLLTFKHLFFLHEFSSFMHIFLRKKN